MGEVLEQYVPQVRSPSNHLEVRLPLIVSDRYCH
jgi:hypothetical protein